MGMTTDQLMFLQRHKIGASQVFDATGFRKEEYDAHMRVQEKLFAFGVTPCAAGHTLRSRSGNCIQCNTANIAFILRHYRRATVYIAASRSKRLVKIGLTTQIENREDQLRKYLYGEADDWIMVSSVHCENAGKVESSAQSKLQGCSTLCGIRGESRAQQARAERRQRSGNRLPRPAEL